MINPLAADMTACIDSMEKEQPGIFGESPPRAQAFSLFCSAIGAGVLTGPAWAAFAYSVMGWTFYVCSMGILSATAFVPVVSRAKSSLLCEIKALWVSANSSPN